MRPFAPTGKRESPAAEFTDRNTLTAIASTPPTFPLRFFQFEMRYDPFRFPQVLLAVCAAPVALSLAAEPTTLTDSVDRLSLAGYRPHAAFTQAFDQAPDASPVKDSPPIAITLSETGPGQTTLVLPNYPIDESLDSPFPVDNPGPLIRVRFGESFKLGDHTVRMLALIERKSVPHAHEVTEWAIGPDGKPLTPESVAALLDGYPTPDLPSLSDTSRRLWLILESDTPMDYAMAHLRRTDTGDAGNRHEAGSNTRQAKNRLIIGVTHPFLDAPPAEIGLLLFGGTPEPMTTLSPEAPVHRGPVLRKLYQASPAEISPSPRYSHSSSSFERDAHVALFGKKFSTSKKKESIRAASASITMKETRPEVTGAWYFFNEKAPIARYLPAGDRTFIRNILLPENIRYCCSFQANADISLLRFPLAERALISLPNLPGSWPNRGVTEPLDWKVHIAKDAESSQSPVGIALAIEMPNGHRVESRTLPVHKGETLTYRELIRRHYVQELAKGYELHFEPEESRIIARQSAEKTPKTTDPEPSPLTQAKSEKTGR